MSARVSGQPRKYEVIPTSSGWGVLRAGDLVGEFAAPKPAIEHACYAAREDARCGRLAIVTTQTHPQEFHSYTPDERGSAVRRLYPRLVVSR